MNLAWRCLYAAIVAARVEESEVDLAGAVKRTMAMLLGRVTAHGEKWRRWYLSVLHTSKHKKVAEKYRNYILIKTEMDATYTVNPEIEKYYSELL